MGQSEGSHLLAYDTDGNPIYEGWAIRNGSETASAIWRIKRYTWTAGNMVEEACADGNLLYDNIWDNRATTVSYTVAT